LRETDEKFIPFHVHRREILIICQLHITQFILRKRQERYVKKWTLKRRGRNRGTIRTNEERDFNFRVATGMSSIARLHGRRGVRRFVGRRGGGEITQGETVWGKKPYFPEFKSEFLPCKNFRGGKKTLEKVVLKNNEQTRVVLVGALEKKKGKGEGRRSGNKRLLEEKLVDHQPFSKDLPSERGVDKKRKKKIQKWDGEYSVGKSVHLYFKKRALQRTERHEKLNRENGKNGNEPNYQGDTSGNFFNPPSELERRRLRRDKLCFFTISLRDGGIGGGGIK